MKSSYHSHRFHSLNLLLKTHASPGGTSSSNTSRSSSNSSFCAKKLSRHTNLHLYFPITGTTSQHSQKKIISLQKTMVTYPTTGPWKITESKFHENFCPRPLPLLPLLHPLHLPSPDLRPDVQVESRCRRECIIHESRSSTAAHKEQNSSALI